MVERIELKISGMYWGAGQSAPPEVYYILCCIPEGSTLWRVSGEASEQRQTCSWWHCRVLFCEISM